MASDQQSCRGDELDLVLKVVCVMEADVSERHCHQSTTQLSYMSDSYH
jgi:hypothetical protein